MVIRTNLKQSLKQIRKTKYIEMKKAYYWFFKNVIQRITGYIIKKTELNQTELKRTMRNYEKSSNQA